MSLIKREDAIKAVLSLTMYKGSVPVDSVIYNIEHIPSAEKQGEWICHKGIWVDEEYYPTNYECNNCHHFVISGSDRNFCPNCGCRMKGADDE